MNTTTLKLSSSVFRQVTGCRNLASSLHKLTVSVPHTRAHSTVAVSPLDSLSEGFRPSQALDVLQQKGAKYGFIKRTEIAALFDAARPGTPRDAKVIVTSLKEFKRNCNLIIDNRQAHPALDGILRSMLPRRRPEEYPVPKSVGEEEWSEKRRNIQAKREFDASLYAIGALVDAQTGLITTVYTEEINKVLEMLRNSITKLEKLSLDSELSLSESDVKEASKLHQQIFRMLKTRSQKPERRMNKKAARKYLKSVKTTQGPDKITVGLIQDLKRELLAAKEKFKEKEEETEEIDEESAKE